MSIRGQLERVRSQRRELDEQIESGTVDLGTVARLVSSLAVEAESYLERSVSGLDGVDDAINMG